MNPKLGLRAILVAIMLAGGMSMQPHPSLAGPRFVALPEINNNTIAPRIIYIENPRFPRVVADDLRKLVQAATALVKEHFGITVESPAHIPVLNIDDVFAELVDNKPPDFESIIGDFHNGKVDWEVVRKNLVEQIGKQKDPLARQIEFARPYLIRPLEREDLDSFSRAVIETFKSRLSHWTVAKLNDGHPVIGEVPGRPDLPFNEYGYWTLMAKRGVDAEIILTNQLVASVEYIPIPVHTSIRGGITGDDRPNTIHRHGSGPRFGFPSSLIFPTTPISGNTETATPTRETKRFPMRAPCWPMRWVTNCCNWGTLGRTRPARCVRPKCSTLHPG